MPKRDDLVRFGVAMESSLLRAFDALVKKRDSTRSELLRDLARAEVTRAQVSGSAPAVATVTIVYDHHVRDLTEKLTDLQHTLGAQVRSSMHVHLDQAHCLEVIILQGPADELRQFAERVFATRGVKHGGIEMIDGGKSTRDGLHVHLHEHAHVGEHHHHEHEHEHEHEHDAGHGHAHPHTHEAGHGHGHGHEHVGESTRPRTAKKATKASK